METNHNNPLEARFVMHGGSSVQTVGASVAAHTWWPWIIIKDYRGTSLVRNRPPP